MVFEANFTVPETEEYEFSLGSDDGSILIIDGEGIIDNDGMHNHVTLKAKEKLDAGEHTLKLLYFQGAGGTSLALQAKTKSRGTLLFTKERTKKGGGKSHEPILLQPENPGEAIVHRAFLPNAKPRAIAVGYPGEVNVCWDADTLNLAYVWRGAFMNVAGHWNGRGSASKPVGVDTVKTAAGLPFQVLESMDEAWVPFSEAKIKYQRDTSNPTREITFNLKHPDYQFRGYRLDKKRFPTFHYDFQDIHVNDSFSPKEVDGVMSVVRSVGISGKPAKHTYMRLADTGPLTIKDGWIDVGKNLSLKLEGAKPIIRGDSKKELLVEIEGQSESKITYRWNKALAVAGK